MKIKHVLSALLVVTLLIACSGCSQKNQSVYSDDVAKLQSEIDKLQSKINTLQSNIEKDDAAINKYTGEWRGDKYLLNVSDNGQAVLILSTQDNIISAAYWGYIEGNLFIYTQSYSKSGYESFSVENYSSIPTNKLTYKLSSFSLEKTTANSIVINGEKGNILIPQDKYNTYKEKSSNTPVEVSVSQPSNLTPTPTSAPLQITSTQPDVAVSVLGNYNGKTYYTVTTQSTTPLVYSIKLKYYSANGMVITSQTANAIAVNNHSGIFSLSTPYVDYSYMNIEDSQTRDNTNSSYWLKTVSWNSCIESFNHQLLVDYAVSSADIRMQYVKPCIIFYDNNSNIIGVNEYEYNLSSYEGYYRGSYSLPAYSINGEIHYSEKFDIFFMR